MGVGCHDETEDRILDAAGTRDHQYCAEDRLVTAETPHAEWRKQVPVVDAHGHFDPALADRCLDHMDRNGIETYVDITPNLDEDLSEKLDVAEQHPDRFGVFAGVDFDGFGTAGWSDREIDQVTEAIDNGALGVKFWKELGLEHTDDDGELIRIDDERLAPVIDAIGDAGGVAAFHIADPQAFFDPLTPENERYEQLQRRPEWWFGDRETYPYDWWQLIRQFERVIGRHLNTTILGAHFGCAAEELGYVADLMRNHDHYIVDVAARVPTIGRHPTERVRDVFLEHQDRILFGTDYAVRADSTRTGADIDAIYDAHWKFFETDEEELENPPINRGWRVDAIDLPRAVLEQFYASNARRYLNL